MIMNTKRNIKIILLICILAVFIVLTDVFFIKPIKNSFYLISSPIERFLSKAGNNVCKYFTFLFKATELERENERLYQENLSLISQNIKLQSLIKENEALRKALNIGMAKKFDFAFARQVSREVDRDVILISAGKKDGVSAMMPVITPQMVLVGKVEESFYNFSKVALISDKKNVFDITIKSKNDILGVAKGSGGSGLSFDLVPKSANIEKGDIVLTTNLDNNFPAGLLVGEIKKIDKSDVKPFLKGTINPYFEKQGTDILFVIKNFLKKK